MEPITSVSNPTIKKIKKLISSSKFRDKERLFIVEGEKIIAEVPQNLLLKVVYKKGYSFKKDYGCDCIEVTDNVFKSISNTVTPSGILAICKMPEETFFKPDDNSIIVVLDRVQDPGNVGTIIRTCLASGVDYLVLLDGCVSVYNDKVIRSSMGAIFKQKIVKEVAAEEVLSKIKTPIYATTVDAEQRYYDVNYTSGACFLMGNEGSGLSEKVIKKATDQITIPISEKIDSLNVALSTAILLFECNRQKNQ